MSFQDGPFDFYIDKTVRLNKQNDEIQAGIGREFAQIYDSYGGQYVWKIWHYDDDIGKDNWFYQGYYDVYVMQ